MLKEKKNYSFDGKFVSVDSLEYLYVIKGRHKKGVQVGKWKYYYNSILDRKEIYKGNTCFTKYFHKNRKLKQKGYTKIEYKKVETHWYYHGNWKYYNSKRKLIVIKNYQKGEFKDSLIIK